MNLRRWLVAAGLAAVPLVGLATVGNTLGAWIGYWGSDLTVPVGLLAVQSIGGFFGAVPIMALLFWAAYNLKPSARLSSRRIRALLKFGLFAEGASLLLSLSEVGLARTAYGSEAAVIVPAVFYAAATAVWGVLYVVMLYFALKQVAARDAGRNLSGSETAEVFS